MPNPRRVGPRTPVEVLELAVALKKEVPARTAVRVAAMLGGFSQSSSFRMLTLQNVTRRQIAAYPYGCQA